MKPSVSFLILALLLMLGFAGSCTFETDSSGKLAGMWHLTSVDTVGTGGRNNMRDSASFWMFENKLLQLSNRTGTITMRFNRSGDSLTVSKPYWYINQGDDEALEDASGLRPFGINSLQESFKVNTLTGGKMILQSQTLVLHFSKF